MANLKIGRKKGKINYASTGWATRGAGRGVTPHGEIKAASPVVREEQNSADSSTSCILVRHSPHLEYHFFFPACSLIGYFIVHSTFARGGAREEGGGGGIIVDRLYRLSGKRMRVTPQNLHRPGNFRLIGSTVTAAERLERAAPPSSCSCSGVRGPPVDSTTPRVPLLKSRRSSIFLDFSILLDLRNSRAPAFEC